MRKVTVAKADLIGRLQANRDNHRRLYEQAMDGYRRAAVGQLNTWVDALTRGAAPLIVLDLPVPADHTDDYDTALDMLGMAVGDTIEIEVGDFRSYVRDDWAWKKRFVETNSFYAVE